MPTGAIIVTDTDESRSARQIIDNDTRTKEHLFVGALWCHLLMSVCITEGEIAEKTDVVLVEQFCKRHSGRCLLHSIKIDDIRYGLGLFSLEYYKCEILEDDGVTCYPRFEIIEMAVFSCD